MLSLPVCHLLLAILFVSVIPLTVGFELPFLGSCTLKDEECHKKCVDQFFEMYGHGIPELDIATMDPMNLGNITTDNSENANFILALNMIDVKIHKFPITKCVGVSIKGFTKDGSKPIRLTAKFRTPEAIMRTHSHVKGKVLIFNVKGETDLEVNMKDINIAMTAVCEPYSKDNQIYFRLKSLTTMMTIGSMKTAFKNSTLLGQDQVFADTFAETINDNWMVLRDEMQPRLEAATRSTCAVILDKLLATMPHDRFFKEE